MRLARLFRAAVDPLLARWPTGFGGHRLRQRFWKNRFAYCGASVHFDDCMLVVGFDSIRIGNGTSFMSNTYLYANDNGRLEIGSRCSFNHNVLLGAASGELIIGSDVLVGPNTVLRAADHEFGRVDLPIRLQGHRRGKIVIGDNVWLAANVVVTSGVTIGNGCVVGAGSVVTRDLPPMMICAGNPARPIGTRSMLAKGL